jgi:pectate lyase
MEQLRNRFGFGVLPVAVLLGAVACSGSDDNSGDNQTGTTPVGGSSSVAATGGATSSIPTATGGSVTMSGTATTTNQGGSSEVTSTAGTATGGTVSTGGAAVTGGTTATGGKSSTGGTTATGGKSSTGGTTATGGKSSTGGTTATGGKSSTGGTTATGGNTGTCSIPTPPNTANGYGATVTGGGNKTPVEVNSMEALVTALAAYKKGTAGLVLRYTGTFDFTSIAANPCAQYTKAEQTVDIKDMSNVTIIGAPGSAMNFGLHFMRVNNVIIRNLRIGYIPGSGDAIGIEGDSYNFWIDHNEFFSSMVECSGAGDGEFDGLLDIKDGSHNMTFSYNYFHDHHKVGLMGSSDSDTFDWRVTLHHNRYENVGSRLPLQRGGNTHIYNNYYNNVMVTGINVRMGGNSLVESNYFENSKNPVTSRDSSAIGYWELRNNFVGTGITWTTADAPSANGDSWTTTKAFSASLGYSYTPDPAACVKAIVTATAGAKLSL